MSRSTKITLLLVLDIIFFLVELTVGHAVGSLALIADSFHMLNDVMSLIVALYAIKLTASNPTDPRYSYGWHRAEILAALVNGVFLLALCFSVALEALGRFFKTEEIQNPKLIVIVGSFGFVSNILGLLLFHEHSHSHDGLKDKPTEAELSQPHPPAGDRIPGRQSPIDFPIRPRSPSYSDFSSSLYGHPAATRASLVKTANEIALGSSPPTNRRATIPHPSHRETPRPKPSTNNATDSSALDPNIPLNETAPLLPRPRHDADHGHAHSHAGSMNMQALVLHVIGDALGNVGVIATGLIIWLTDWSFKYYCDPIISLVITVIIFSSALPLVRGASSILLQGVPAHVSLDSVRDSILQVEGVLSLHELHVWQLSESKVIASVHVLASKDHDFMPIAAKIRKTLHHHGIHSSTIQPEYFCPGIDSAEEQVKRNSNGEPSCLILCPSDQSCDPAENACCPPPSVEA